MILTQEALKEIRNERYQMYGRFSKEEHDELVEIGLQLLNATEESMHLNLSICNNTEFISYVISNDIIQIMQNINFVRNMLLEPSIEIMINEEQREEYFRTHRELLEMLARDRPKLIKNDNKKKE